MVLCEHNGTGGIARDAERANRVRRGALRHQRVAQLKGDAAVPGGLPGGSQTSRKSGEAEGSEAEGSEATSKGHQELRQVAKGFEESRGRNSIGPALTRRKR
jgi:chromosome segregation ATPase